MEVKPETEGSVRKKKRLRPKASGRGRHVSSVSDAITKNHEEVPTTSSLAEAPKFSLTDVTDKMCAEPPEFLDVRDEQLSLALLGDMEKGMLDDMIGYFLIGEGVKADERKMWGPPKWRYSEADEFDHFDHYAANGCPNCGASYGLEFHHSFCLNPPALVCHSCGHRACPMHFDDESDTLVDRLDGVHLSEKGRGKVAEALRTKTPSDPLQSSSPSSSTGANGDSLLFGSAQVSKRELESASAKTPTTAAVYLRGCRTQHYFGQNCKEWWQSQFLPRSVRLNDLHRTLTMIGMMSKLKAPTIDETCEVCGFGKAYFHTYQARSADEGMTIMYECTRCHARKTFNN